MASKRIMRSAEHKPLTIALALLILFAMVACSKNSSIRVATQMENPGATVSFGSDNSEPTNNASTPLPANQHGKVFGLTMGMPLTQLDNIWFKKENDMYIGFPPERSDLFINYGIIASKKSGLCEIIAMTSDMDVKDAGDKIRNKVDEIAKILTVKYGAPSQKIEATRKDAQENNLKYASFGLSTRETNYGYVWKSGDNATLPSDLETITVTVFGVDAKTSRADLKYSFKNKESCKEDLVVEKAAML